MTDSLINQDKDNRRQALDAGKSFIIQAPAGSGKTELIIQRYLNLLNHVNKPQEILAITFTKKAASEMRSRIINALNYADNHPEPAKAHEKLTWQLAKRVLARDKDRQWNLLDNPNQLQIKTIDSFCSFLTSQLPLLSHFGSQPEIMPKARPLYQEAVYELLSHIENSYDWSNAVTNLLSHMDNNLDNLANLLIQLLEKRDQWLSYVSLNLDDSRARDRLTQNIASVVKYHLAALIESMPSEYTEDMLTLLRFSTTNLAHVNSPFSAAADFPADALPDIEPENLLLWKLIANILLTKDDKWRSRLAPEIGFPYLKTLSKQETDVHRQYHTVHKRLVENVRHHNQFLAQLINVKNLPHPAYSDEDWQILKALLEVLRVCVAQLRVTFQSSGKIDFIENAQAALQALGDDDSPTDLALALDYQIKHILVDEFQDTSSTQYELLKKLTYGWQEDDGRSLFVVGDPMQSIYRFRLADVGIFIRMQLQGIGEINLIPLSLSVNFRSSDKIVNWNNQHFALLFPDYNDIGSGAVHYSQSIAISESSDDTPVITLTDYIDNGDNAQAVAVAALAQKTLEKYPGENIAILVRSRSHLAAIIPALKAARLPYSAIAIDPLESRPYIQDLLSLTRALIHPADKIAWLAVLRAPWCGLSLNDLLMLSLNNNKRTIWECLSDSQQLSKISSEGNNHISRIRPVLENAVNERSRSSLRVWIENTWLALGGPATLKNYDETADVNAFLEMLDNLEHESVSINIESLSDHIENLFAAAHSDNAAIQIMTIHSAKGLEFDTVILPHLEKSGRGDEKNLLSWIEHPLDDDDYALLLAPINASGNTSSELYSYIEYLHKMKSEFEKDRLFYVATTRAKKRLHLLYNSKDEENARKGSFLAKLLPLVKVNHTIVKDGISPSQNSNESRTANKIRRLNSNWSNPFRLRRELTTALHHSPGGFALVDESAKLIGTITHGVLQRLSLSGNTWWNEMPDEVRKTYISNQLRQQGVAVDQHESAAITIIKIINLTIHDKRGAWILSPHQHAYSEYAITCQTDNGIENLIIDRTFVDNDNIRWIIDYKTAQPQQEDVKSFMERQKIKYSEQMQKYKNAFAEMDNRKIRLGLYFPSIAGWTEWE